ncbi:MAG: hypothetical protein GX051_03950 [Clostridiales bacterium]|nr:hypothetical protein [Clostridiales bacterium]
MKEYAKKLKTQNIFYAIATLALTAVQILAHTGVISPAYNGEYSDFWRGFIGGVSAGLSALFIVGFIINIRAIINEERLRKLYIKENDERAISVAVKGKSAGASAGICFLIVAGIISGYFNITVFVTVIACAVSLVLFVCGGKIYYDKKM